MDKGNSAQSTKQKSPLKICQVHSSDMRRYQPLQPFAGTALEVCPRRSTQGLQSLYTRPIVMCGLVLTFINCVSLPQSSLWNIVLYPCCFVAHLDMSLPCGLPEGKAVPLLPPDDYVVGLHWCHRFLLLGPGEGASANLKRAPPPFPLSLLLRGPLDPVLSIISPSLAMSPKAMCPTAAMERLPASKGS